MEALSEAGLSQQHLQSMTKGLYGFTPMLEQMCRQAACVQVGEAMIPIGARDTIEEDASLSEAIRRFVLEHVQSMLVTRDNEVVGILRLSDVFETVAEIIRNSERE